MCNKQLGEKDMGYLDSNYNASTHGAKGRYTPSEQKEINTEKEQSKNVVAEGNKKEQIKEWLINLIVLYINK